MLVPPFDTDMAILLLAQGLLLFLTGFTVLLQSRYLRQLAWFRSYSFLAAFAVLQAFAHWISSIGSVQVIYVSARAIELLQMTNLTLNALSFLSLGLFGSRLMIDIRDRHHRLQWVPVAIATFWLVTFLGSSDIRGGIWPDYLLRLSGVALASLGLYGQQVKLRRTGTDALRLCLKGLILSILLFGLSTAVMSAGKFAPPGSIVGFHGGYSTWILIALVLRGLSGVLMLVSSAQFLGVSAFDNQRETGEANRVQTLLDERYRIARELHDGIMQSLYAVGLRLEGAVCMSEGVPTQVREETMEALVALRVTISDIRRYVMNLRGCGEDESLQQRLAATVAEFERSTHVPIEFRPTLVPTDEYDETEINHLCQIVREALSNALRHGRPSEISVVMTTKDSAIRVVVRDDGTGFAIAERDSEDDHYGLGNMRHRARILGGQLEIRSAPGKGTTVCLEIPRKGGSG